MTKDLFSASAVLLLPFAFLCVSSVQAEPVDDDIWAIQPNGTTKSATLGKSKKATLRARLSRPEESAVEAPPEKSPHATIHWKVPADEVTAYTIRYGTRPELLDTKVRILVDSLAVVENPIHGKVFAFPIAELPKTEFVYYSLQAEDSNGMSPATPVQKTTTSQNLN